MGLTARQQEFRRTGVCSSEIAVLAGISPFRQRPVDLYCLKLGLTEPEPSSEAMDAGTWLEPVIRDRYAHERSARVMLATEFFENSVDGTIRHASCDIALATVDGVVLKPGEHAQLDGLLECKNVGAQMERHWHEGPDGVPLYYQCQVQWQMEVADAPWTDVAALLGGQRFRYWRITRDREFGELLLQAAERFWRDHILAKEPPLERDEDLRRYLDARFPMASREACEAPNEAHDVARRLIRLRKALAKIEALEDRAITQLKDLLADRAGFEGGWWRCSWRNVTGRVSWKRVAEALGAKAVSTDKYRDKPSRHFKFSLNDSDDEQES